MIGRAERSIEWLAGLLLRLFPPVFRRRYGAAYRDAALHRLGRELRGRRSVVSAWSRTVALLVSDALRAVTAEWLRVGTEPDVRSRMARRRLAWLSGGASDVRLATRVLGRRPGFSTLVIVTLGLGIGVSASVFSALDRIVLRPLPYAVGDRLAYLALANPERGWQFAPYGEVVERWREGARTVEAIEVYRHLSGVVADQAGARVERVVGISDGLTAMLGVRPLAGRIPRYADTGRGEPTLIVSERHWRGEWGSDPAVIGRSVRMNDTLFTVAGVWPEAARLDYRGSPAFFRVLSREAESPAGDFSLVLALLRPGVTPSMVEAELGSLTDGFDDIAGMVPVVNPPWGFLGDTFIRALWLIFWGGIVLMVVAVLTATNLMLGRADSRTEEIGLRMALGASGARVARLFMAETVLLAGAGMALALFVARSVSSGLALVEPGSVLPDGTAGLAGTAVMFAALLALACALVCALVPLAVVLRPGVRPLVRLTGARTTGRQSRFRSTIVAAQAGLAVILVTGATLMARSLVSLTRVDTGMAMDRLLVVSVRLPEDRYPAESARRAYFDRAREALESIPGVVRVTTSSSPPMAFSLRGGVPFVEGEPEPVPAGNESVATTGAPPGYFETVGIPVLEGRELRADERGSVVVNESFARSRPGSVVGRSLRFAGDTTARTIVGVVGDVRSNGLMDEPDRLQFYYPATPGGSYIRFIVRTAGDPLTILPVVRSVLARIDPGIPLREATTGPRMIRGQTARIRFVAALLTGFACLGLVFAIGGVYGTVSIQVGRRVREVGLRMALGASAGHVLGRVMATGLGPVAAGVITGGVIVLWASPVLEALLFEVGARDPASLAIGATILLIAGALGCCVPALRASRIDPAVALRAD